MGADNRTRSRTVRLCCILHLLLSILLLPRALTAQSRLVAGWLVTALLFISWLPARAQQARASEAELKAAFVFNFAKFVDWPGSALSEAQDLVICIAGDELVASTVTRVVEGRRLNGHQLVIQRRPSDTGEFNGCHVVFLGERLQWRRSLAVLRSSPVLTIADGEEFARKGGIIAFVLENDRVRFVVNPAAGDRAGLKISSRLLVLARIVQEEKGF